MGSKPPNHGQSTHGLRGDYSRMRPDYTVEQDHSAYGADEHDRWRRLYRRQIELVPGRACRAYQQALASLDYASGVPRFDTVNRQLGAASGWQLVAVPGLVPDLVFFDHLASRRFPVTWWLRREDEFEYIVEPDVFHDFFGHVPMLFDPVFADYMQAYGAGILSSPSEIDHAVRSPRPRRVAFDLRRIMRSRYRIDAFQETYFVIDHFQQLFEATEPDFAPLYRELAALPELAPDAALPEDRLVAIA